MCEQCSRLLDESNRKAIVSCAIETCQSLATGDGPIREQIQDAIESDKNTKEQKDAHAQKIHELLHRAMPHVCSRRLSLTECIISIIHNMKPAHVFGLAIRKAITELVRCCYILSPQRVNTSLSQIKSAVRVISPDDTQTWGSRFDDSRQLPTHKQHRELTKIASTKHASVNAAKRSNMQISTRRALEIGDAMIQEGTPISSIIALAMFTGLRLNEIKSNVKTVRTTPPRLIKPAMATAIGIDHKCTLITFTGMATKAANNQATRPVIHLNKIDIVRLMRLARKAPDYDFSVYKNITKKLRGLFDSPTITFMDLRALYAGLSYDLYADKSRPKSMWTNLVLGHLPSSIGVETHYEFNFSE